MEKIDLKSLCLKARETSIENTKPRLTKALGFLHEIILQASSKGLYSKVKDQSKKKRNINIFFFQSQIKLFIKHTYKNFKIIKEIKI